MVFKSIDHDFRVEDIVFQMHKLHTTTVRCHIMYLLTQSYFTLFSLFAARNLFPHTKSLRVNEIKLCKVVILRGI